MEDVSREIDRKVQNAAETFSSTVLAVIDKLTGKQANVKFGFEDLTLESDLVRVKLNGAIVLEIVTKQQQ